MPTFLLTHHHTALECAHVFAAWRGFTSPLRHRDVLSSCPQGGHRLWWVVDAPDEAAVADPLRSPPALLGYPRLKRLQVRLIGSIWGI